MRIHGKTTSVTLTFTADQSDIENEFRCWRWWSQHVPCTKFCHDGQNVYATIKTDRLPTKDAGAERQVAGLCEGWLRERIKRDVTGTLPTPAAFDDVDLSSATLIGETPGSLKAHELKGFAPTVEIPFLTGKAMQKLPERKPPIFEGFARRQDVFAFVGKSKKRKSFLVYQSLIAFAAKLKFLGFKPGGGRALLIDTEMHTEETIRRLHRQVAGYGLKWSDVSANLDLISLRGVSADISTVRDHLLNDRPEPYTYMVFDNLYRLLPPRTNENDAAAITGVLSIVAEIARERDAGVNVVAHAPKGDTKNRAVEDLTSGSGAFGRFVDFQFGMYDHVEPDCVVLKAMGRADKAPPDIVIRFNEDTFLFEVEPDLNPRAIASGQPTITVADILKHVPAKWSGRADFITEIQQRFAVGERRARMLVNEAVASGDIEHKPNAGNSPAMIRRLKKAA